MVSSPPEASCQVGCSVFSEPHMCQKDLNYQVLSSRTVMDLAFKAKLKSSWSHLSAEPLKHKHSTLKKAALAPHVTGGCSSGSDQMSEHNTRLHIQRSAWTPLCPFPQLRSRCSNPQLITSYRSTSEVTQSRGRRSCEHPTLSGSTHRGEGRHSNATEHTKLR